MKYTLILLLIICKSYGMDNGELCMKISNAQDPQDMVGMISIQSGGDSYVVVSRSEKSKIDDIKVLSDLLTVSSKGENWVVFVNTKLVKPIIVDQLIKKNREIGNNVAEISINAPNRLLIIGDNNSWLKMTSDVVVKNAK